jgi:hypothetical protein
VYIDVIVVGRTFQGQLGNLQKLFQRFGGAHLKLNPEKCRLFQKEVWYLRHVMSPEGVTAGPETLEALPEWPTLRDKHELRSFLGLCTCYKWFIASFADIAKPLTKLRGEANFPMVPRVKSRLPVTEGGPVHLTHPLISAARKKSSLLTEMRERRMYSLLEGQEMRGQQGVGNCGCSSGWLAPCCPEEGAAE